MGNLAGKSPNEMEVLMETSSTSQWFSVATFDYQTVAGLKPCPMCRLATGLLVSTQKYLITNMTAYRKKLCSTVWGKGEYCNKHGNIAILAIQQGNVAFEASYSDPNNLKLKQSDWALSWDSWPKKRSVPWPKIEATSQPLIWVSMPPWSSWVVLNILRGKGS